MLVCILLCLPFFVQICVKSFFTGRFLTLCFFSVAAKLLHFTTKKMTKIGQRGVDGIFTVTLL